MNPGFSFLLVCILLSGMTVNAIAQENVSTAAAESLLSSPDEAGWNLEAMMATHHNEQTLKGDVGYERESSRSSFSRKTVSAQETKKLLAQVQLLKSALAKAQHDLKLTKAEQVAASLPADDANREELTKLRVALQESKQQTDALTTTIETLKAGLADREQKLRVLSTPQDKLRHILNEKTTELEKSSRELSSLRAALAEKEVRLVALKESSGEKDRVERLIAIIKERDKSLAAAMKEADDNAAALKELQVRFFRKERELNNLHDAITARSEELKQAAAALADLRGRQQSVQPSTSAQKQAYMAGIMMADGLNQRIGGWQQAGVKTDSSMFLVGLTDGLSHKLRLKAGDARKAQNAFMQSVQQGVIDRVASANKQLKALAKGRKPLKSSGGISWYRVRKGKPVPQGKPVTLSMIERVAGGEVISRVPPLTLTSGDDVPLVVKDGMYLPGEGGEVVAYALARSVYGDLPLPSGVQPFTVMEYHLTGESVRAGK